MRYGCGATNAALLPSCRQMIRDLRQELRLNSKAGVEDKFFRVIAYGCFPTIRGTLLGVPNKKGDFLGPCWGPPILGNYHIGVSDISEYCRATWG